MFLSHDKTMTKSHVSPLTLYDRAEYQALAERVATGPDDGGVTRALVVINPTSATLSGQALFPVDMPWSRDRAFPPISVYHAQTKHPVLFELLGIHWATYAEADPRGREGMQRFRFMMTLNVEAIPPHGYSTYIASFTEDDNTFPSPIPVGPFRPELVVVETLSHPGELRPSGALISSTTKGLVVQWIASQNPNEDSLHLVVTNNARSAVIGVLNFASAISSASRIDHGGAPTPLAPPEAGVRLELPRIGTTESIHISVQP